MPKNNEPSLWSIMAPHEKMGIVLVIALAVAVSAVMWAVTIGHAP